MRVFVYATLASALAVVPIAPPAKAQVPDPCAPRAATGRSVNVRNVADLERAIGVARPGDDILLADGEYALTRMLDIPTPGVTVRGRSGDATKVILHGRGMTGDTVGVAISVSAPRVTVADITIRDVGFHGVQVRGESGASDFSLFRARIMDTGEQLLKGSFANNGRFADNGLVACSLFSYTTHAPSDYTNGVDLLGAKGWVIRDNRFERIRGPEKGGWVAGPAILAWAASEDTTVERNVIIDSFRGIALGLTPGTASAIRGNERRVDHIRGLVRNNVIVNLNRWADEAIEATATNGVRIEHNTVLVEGGTPWSIAVRFAPATATIRNNLTNRRIFEREGGRAVLEGNVSNATRTWFVDARGANLRLAAPTLPAVDAGVPIPDVPLDYFRKPRAGRAPDAGAIESDSR